jgi:hypothetical protein
VRAVCVLCVALVCVMGTVQAVHSHPENSTATTHHTCSICATAHVGLSPQTTLFAPILASTALTSTVAEVSLVIRPAIAEFIRPPPAL